MATRGAGVLTTLVLGVATAGGAREIVDGAGRRVTIPEKVQRICAAQPYTNVLAYMLAPDLLIGQVLELKGEERRYAHRGYLALPALGGAPMQGKPMNMETVLAAHPDIVLLKGGSKEDPTRSAEPFTRIGLPVAYVDLETIDDYPSGIESLGRILGREPKARRMATFARALLARTDKVVAGIPAARRVRVYYAESPDGLSTETDQSFHAEAIRRAGGTIVHKGLLKTHVGMEKVSLEQVVLYDPDVIVSNEPAFARMAYADPRWRKVRAVAQHRIYTVPKTPFNWIDRPPSVMRIAGIPWLLHHFYPKAYGKDQLRKDLDGFHRLFLDYSPTAADLDAWTR
jgi:iron complex transport system substrate-binding protein